MIEEGKLINSNDLLSAINAIITLVINLRRLKEMAVESIGEKYRCNICGN